MPRTLAALLAAVIALALAPAALAAAHRAWTPYDRPETNGVVTDRDVMITMRDGTRLAADVMRPDEPGRYPVLVTQTPYGKNAVGGAIGGGDHLVRRGYVQVTVDVRGTGSSEGTWDSFGDAEQRDGYDVVEWAASQPWSDGKVGLDGPSYMAITQLTTAALRPPHLKAIFPVVPMADGYRDITFSGGSTNTSFIPQWLGLVTAGSVAPPAYALDGNPDHTAQAVGVLASHVQGAVTFQGGTVAQAVTGGDLAYDGPFWKTRSPLELVDRIRVPAFVVGGLHDIFQRGEPLIYERLARNVPARLLIGPWTHLTGSTGAGLPAPGVPASLSQIELRWFDHWLKGLDTRIGAIPQVTEYRWGAERWETQRDWPDPRLRPLRLHLRGGQALAPAAPERAEPAQSFPQQPLSGICTQSTSQWTMGEAEPLPCTTDDRPNEALGNAIYTTPPLERALRIDGPALARLWITTTASDAALTVRLTDVDPSGASRELTAGWLSAGFRALDRSRSRFVRGRLLQPWHPFTRESWRAVPAGQPVRLDVEVFPTSAVVGKGHRLRLTVTPADFPHQVPPLPQLAGQLGGVDTVLTDPEHASYVELPRVGRRAGGRLPLPRLLRGDGS